MKSIIDTGPLVAFFDESDFYCKEIRNFLKTYEGQLVSNLSVITEVSYLISDNKKAQLNFIEWIKDGAVEILNQSNEFFLPIHLLMKKYQDRQMDFTDASLVSLYETFQIKNIITLDSDFLFYKTSKGKPINILNSKMLKKKK